MVTLLSKTIRFRTHFDSQHVKGFQTLLSSKISILLIYKILGLFVNKLTANEMSKKPHFRKPFNSQHVKSSETLQQSARQNLNHIVSSLWEKLSGKTSHLVISEILGLFDNKLTTDDNYPVCNRENLPQPIEMQLCKKSFFSIFCSISENYIKVWTFTRTT